MTDVQAHEVETAAETPDRKVTRPRPFTTWSWPKSSNQLSGDSTQ